MEVCKTVLLYYKHFKIMDVISDIFYQFTRVKYAVCSFWSWYSLWNVLLVYSCIIYSQFLRIFKDKKYDAKNYPRVSFPDTCQVTLTVAGIEVSEKVFQLFLLKIICKLLSKHIRHWYSTKHKKLLRQFFEA